MLREQRYVTVQETASILSVSGATVRNWIKHELLRPACGSSGTRFAAEDVRRLNELIRRGDLQRLDRRANKSIARKSFLSNECLDDKSFRNPIESIVSHISSLRMNPSRALFMLSLRLLYQEGICKSLEAGRSIREGFLFPGHSNLARDLDEWHMALGGFSVTEQDFSLLKFELPLQQDVLGLIYQTLLLEGEKSVSGAYYTPGSVIRDIAGSFPGGRRILDPCCGTGRFLLTFGDESDRPDHLHGYDIDGLAVRIARINLMLKFKELDFAPRVYSRNFLLHSGRGKEERAGQFDIIATNPPWGFHFAKSVRDQLAIECPEIRSQESFSYFLRRSIELLSPGGRLSFILPESILFVKSHRDIRKYLLEHAAIDKIIHLGRLFKNVFTPAIRLDLIKEKKCGRLTYINGGSYAWIGQKRFEQNKDYVFDVQVGALDSEILGKVFDMPHTTLEGNADWALGIVTGDNARYLSSQKNDDRYEPIYRGRDVGRYGFKESLYYIKYTPEKFQQSAQECRYRAPEKLVYRFISKSLIFAYDDRRRLTLNSANILIPQIEKYPMKAVLGLFNSVLYQFIFQKKFHSIKVLRAHLEKLPLPLWERGTLCRIAAIADRIMLSGAGIELMDEIIMDLFRLDQNERRHIRNSVR